MKRLGPVRNENIEPGTQYNNWVKRHQYVEFGDQFIVSSCRVESLLLKIGPKKANGMVGLDTTICLNTRIQSFETIRPTDIINFNKMIGSKP